MKLDWTRGIASFLVNPKSYPVGMQLTRCPGTAGTRGFGTIASRLWIVVKEIFRSFLGRCKENF